jgi:hypothetical protein
MTYRINKTDGNQLVDLPDGTFDTDTTSITLIGRNVTSFGEILNENLIKLLENFASSSSPENALKGQLWYDNAAGRLNVYDGNVFRSAGGPVISPRPPQDLVAGDLWLNNDTNQLWFYDGLDLVLAGPIYTNQQGTSGFVVETILDNFNRSHIVAKLVVSNVLLGIFSRDVFTPAQPIPGYATVIKQVNIGFNAAELANMKFDVTVTKTENILTDAGELKNAAQIVYNDEDGTIIGSLTLQSNNGISFGAPPVVEMKIANDKFVIEQTQTGQPFALKTKTPTGTREAISVDALNSRVGFWTDTPQADVDIQGNLRVAGDIIVGGETATINVTVLQVEDKNIVLGNTPQTPTDAAANGGGITLLGSTDKTFEWKDDSDSWTSSENLDLATDKVYKISTTEVLSIDQLGPTVLTSNLQNLGNLNAINMAGGTSAISIVGNEISTGIVDLILNPIGPNKHVSVSNKKIINLLRPTDEQDATTKSYVDEAVYLRGISMSMDITGTNGNPKANPEIEDILDIIAPFYDPVTAPQGVAVNGTRLRLHGTITTVSNTTVSYTPQEDVGFGGDFSRVVVYTAVFDGSITGTTLTVSSVEAGNLQIGMIINAPGIIPGTTILSGSGTTWVVDNAQSVATTTINGSTSVIRDISTDQTLDAPLATVTVSRVNKLFVMTNGGWSWSSDL